MARLFNDVTPDFLQIDQAVVTGPPFSVSAWARSDDLTIHQSVFWIGDKDVADQQLTLRVDGLTGGDPIVMRALAGDASGAFTSSGYSANTWHHIFGSTASSSDRSAYIDGGSKGTNAETIAPSGIDRTTIGMSGDSTPSRGMSGDIAHVAVWDVVLTDDEVATLAEGISPLRVRRDSLIAYWPINGQSPEPDIVGGLNLTLGGAPTQSEEPPIPYSIVAPG